MSAQTTYKLSGPLLGSLAAWQPGCSADQVAGWLLGWLVAWLAEMMKLCAITARSPTLRPPTSGLRPGCDLAEGAALETHSCHRNLASTDNSQPKPAPPK